MFSGLWVKHFRIFGLKSFSMFVESVEIFPNMNEVDQHHMTNVNVIGKHQVKKKQFIWVDEFRSILSI